MPPALLLTKFGKIFSNFNIHRINTCNKDILLTYLTTSAVFIDIFNMFKGMDKKYVIPKTLTPPSMCESSDLEIKGALNIEILNLRRFYFEIF